MLNFLTCLLEHCLKQQIHTLDTNNLIAKLLENMFFDATVSLVQTLPVRPSHTSQIAFDLL